MLHFLTIGFVLGLSAGFAPGPLLTLVISETLRHNVRAGIKVAIAPFITDLPIIIVSVLIISRITDSHTLLAVISFCGAIFIAKMGVDNIRMQPQQQPQESSSSNSTYKGILTNLLSPHPYLFWLTVGVPIMSKAMLQSVGMVAVFLASFYALLVGSKVILAIVVGRSKTFLSGRFYLFTIRVLGWVLCALAGILVYDGFQLLRTSG